LKEGFMKSLDQTQCTAFAGTQRVASGELLTVALKSKEILDRSGDASILIFDDATSETIELDFRGTAGEVLKRIVERVGEAKPASSTEPEPEQEGPRGPGRPKLGVVAREVTLLPRHWDWLSGQPGGASVALRKLVDQARRIGEGEDRVRRSRESAYKFMTAMAGNLPGFEEATRALFAGDRERFDGFVESWPPDIRDHSRTLAAVSFQEVTGSA
jgi:uncharacterized protein